MSFSILTLRSRKPGRRNFRLMAMTTALMAAVGVFAAPLAQVVYFNGKPLTRDVVVQNGRVYVPLQDVARTLGMTVTRKADGYALLPEGGANQINGIRQGKIGDRLVTPKWAFEVRAIREAAQYVEQFCEDKKTFAPRNPSDTLILVECRLANAINRVQTPMLSERMAGNTALACEDGQSYGPLDFDARQRSGKFASYEASPLLPGAKGDFVLVFSVPQGTKPKALVFSLLSYPDDVGHDKTTDVRVTLAN